MTEDVEFVYEQKGREGQTVKYDSNADGVKEDWIIITDRNGTVEIVSANVMKDAQGNELTLGYEDTEIKENLIKYLDINKDGIPDDLDGDGSIEEGGTDLDKDGTVESDAQDIAIASYNNAITTINNYCKEIVTATNNSGVRSVGGTTDTAGNYSSTNFDAWSEGKITAKAGDIYYEQDFVKMNYFGIITTGESYWLASRYVREYSSNVFFGVSRVYADGTMGNYDLWLVYSDGNVYSVNPSRGVRPVVINPSGI